MRGIANIAVGLLGVFSFASPALADEIVTAEAQQLFVPTGFDDNDKAQVVVDGYYPNSCYRLEPSVLEVDLDKKLITIEAKARVVSGFCLQVLVPYSDVVELGILPRGQYTVRTSDLRLEKTLVVSESQSLGPDDTMYAPVDEAYVDYYPVQGKYYAVLNGRFTNTCMRWVKTQVVNANPEVIEVMPIIKLEEGENCREEVFPYKGMKVELPNLPTDGRYLLHVRSLNGTALNTVFNIPVDRR